MSRNTQRTRVRTVCEAPPAPMVFYHVKTSTGPGPPLTALAWHVVWRQERDRFTGGSLQAIKEQRTDRIRVVNRGKQGRAEGTVTLSTPPHPLRHSHAVIFSAQHFLWPHKLSNKLLLLAVPANVSHPLWPDGQESRRADNTFFIATATIFSSNTLSHICSLCLNISLPQLTSRSVFLLISFRYSQCVAYSEGPDEPL